MVFAVPPNAVSIATAPGNKLTWTDTSKNETGWTVQSATSSTGTWTTVATVPSATGPTTNTKITWTGTKKGLLYRVIANNMVGYTAAYAAPAVGYPHISADAATSNIVTP